MAVKNKRLMLTVPKDLEKDVAGVKRDLFDHKPYSEMYRQLIRLGLDTLKGDKEGAKNKISA